jgi:hypothetical protein
MFKWFKKEVKKTPKYLVHLIGTNEVNFVYDDEALKNVINTYGEDRVDITNWPLKF